jgi:hypothetical protein
MFQVRYPFETFPKSFPDLSIFERNHERIAVGGGGGSNNFFEFNFFPIDLMLKKLRNFFSPEPEVTKI